MLDPKEDRYKFAVIDVCEGLHGWISGSGDDYYPDAQEHYEWLKMRMKTWEPTLGRETRVGPNLEKYDRAVLCLVIATIDLYKASKK